MANVILKNKMLTLKNNKIIYKFVPTEEIVFALNITNLVSANITIKPYVMINGEEYPITTYDGNSNLVSVEFYANSTGKFLVSIPLSNLFDNIVLELIGDGDIEVDVVVDYP